MSSTADQIIAARRARIVEVVDARGRTIGVRRIRPSEQFFVVRSAEGGDDLVTLLCAAAVTFIEDDGVRRTTPGDLREPVLWSVVSTLGADGLAAVAYAVWQHAAGPAGGAPSFDPFRPFASGSPVRAAALDVILPPQPPRPIPPAFSPEETLPPFHKP